jgi:hypothetical protein
MMGATAEYLTALASFRKSFWMTNRMRASALTVFCAYVAFILPGIGYQKMTESVIHSGIQASHPALAISFLLMEIGAVAALLAVLAGGLPVAFATLHYAATARRRDILALLCAPAVVLSVIAVYILLVVHLVIAHHPSLHGPTRDDVIAGIGLIALLLVGAVAGAWAVCLAVTRAEIGERIIRFTRLPAVITTVAMVMMFAATLVWGLSLLGSAPQMFYGDDGALATNTAISWGIVIVVMGVTTVIAAIGVRRANSSRQPHAAAAA